jgi:hypothetical protein
MIIMSKTKKKTIALVCIATMMLTLVACGSKNDDVNVDSSSDDSQNVTSESDSNVKDDVVVSESESSSSGEETTNDVSENKTLGDLVINGTSVTIPGKFQPIEGYVVDEDAFVEGDYAIYLKSENSTSGEYGLYFVSDEDTTIDNYLDVTCNMLAIELSSESVPFVLDGEITETSTYDDVQNFYSKIQENVSVYYPSDTNIEVDVKSHGEAYLSYLFEFNDDGSLSEILVSDYE